MYNIMYLDLLVSISFFFFFFFLRNMNKYASYCENIIVSNPKPLFFAD